jgi:methylmalonyl-CoA mutase cobalamin-binding subunit
MKIAYVGGLDRSAAILTRLAEDAGHTLLMHHGHLHGRGSEVLAQLVEQSDQVVIVTDLNSHGAVQLARKVAAEVGRKVILLRRCGVSRFKELLRSLAE